MKLGVSSYAFGWAVGVNGVRPTPAFTEIDLVDFARAQGLSLVQIGDHLPLHTFGETRLEQLRRHASQAFHPVELEIGARGLTRKHLEAYIALAGSLGARLLRFVIDGPAYEPEPSEVVSILRAAITTLESADIILGLENHDRFPARALREMVEAIGSRHVGICLDTANSFGAGEGIAHVVDQLGPLTVNLHVKDFAITRLHHAMGFTIEGRPAGRGMLDVAWLRDSLAVHGRCRAAILETWTPPEPDPVETVAKERRWAEQSLSFLKPFFPER